MAKFVFNVSFTQTVQVTGYVYAEDEDSAANLVQEAIDEAPKHSRTCLETQTFQQFAAGKALRAVEVEIEDESNDSLDVSEDDEEYED